MIKIISLMLMSMFLMGSTTTIFAQPTITAVGGGAPLTCMSANPADASYTITYQVNVPANISVTEIGQIGDLQITAQPAIFPINGGTNGTTFTVTVQSKNNGRETSNNCNNYLLPTPPDGNHLGVDATNWGFAKGRLTVSWYNGDCIDYAILSIFKSFSLHPPIIGPGCIKQGDKITFSVCNILSGHNAPVIGQDKYYWTGKTDNNYDNTDYPPGLDYLYSSADGSSITFRVNDYSFIGSKLYCRFGQCNPATVSDITLNAITFPPGFQLLNSNQTVELSTPSQVNNCIDAINAYATIVLKITRPSTPTGSTPYTYELSSNNYSWGFGNSNTATYTYSTSASPWTQTANIGNLGGEIYIKTKATGTACDARTDVIRIGRNVVFSSTQQGAFYITPHPSLGGTCIVPGQTGGYLLNTFPGNIPITWNYPPTWTPQGSPVGPPTLNLVAGYTTLVGAAVTASIGGCSPTAPFPVYVKPNSIGTTPTITYNGTTYASASPVCVPFSTNPQTFTVNGINNAVSYVWTPPSGWLPLSTTNQIAVAPNLTTTGNLFVKGIADPPGNTCFSTNTFLVTAYAPILNAITGPTCLKAGNADALTLGAALTTNVSYTVTGNFPSGTTFTWSVPPGMYVANSLLGAGTTTITFTCNGVPPATGSTYPISVTATKGNCSTATSINVSVNLRNDILNSTITSTPSQLLELLLNGSGVDNNISNYQWFQWTPPRSNISGNNSNSITLANLATKGDYGVEATYTDGCKNVFGIIGTGYGNKNNHGIKSKIPTKQSKATNPSQSGDISLLPNPANTTTTLVLSTDIKNASVSIISAEGRLLWKRSSLSTGKTLINTGNWTSGEYTVIVREPNKKAVTKSLIIQKQ